MKYFLIFVLLSGCAAQARDIGRQPSGEDVFGAILKHGDADLQNEPLCKADIKLHEQLALSLSVAFESENTTHIKSTCSPSKFELSSEELIDVWDCSIQVNETSDEGEFISSSIFVFSLTADDFKYLKGSLRCR